MAAKVPFCERCLLQEHELAQPSADDFLLATTIADAAAGQAAEAPGQGAATSEVVVLGVCAMLGAPQIPGNASSTMTSITPGAPGPGFDV